MNVPWERIQDALAAAIRGDDLPPVVSQRTLFGIPSTVEVQMARFAAELAHERSEGSALPGDRAEGEVLPGACGECRRGSAGAGSSAAPAGESRPASEMHARYERDLRRRVAQAACMAGGACLIGRGMRYFIVDGRDSGFDIPAYPFDPKGEFRDFLRERGVADLPGYYASLGIPRERYEDVATHALLVLKRPEGPVRATLLRGAEYCDATRFLPLSESSFLKLCALAELEVLARELGLELSSE